jgi:hypothetical protein
MRAIVFLADGRDDPLGLPQERRRTMHDPDFDPYLPPRAPVGFRGPKQAGTDRVDGNPWLTIWTQPRGTIRAIVDSDPNRSVILLAMIYGISSTLSRAFQKNSGDTISLPTILGLALFVGSIAGVIGNLIMGALVRWTGSWIGGVASLEESRAAVAWGSVPHAVNLVLMAGLIAVFGSDLFRTQGLEGIGGAKASFLVVVGLGQVVLGLWSAVLSVKCVAEVHQFSAWKGLGTFILVLFVIIGIVILLSIILFGGMVALWRGT